MTMKNPPHPLSTGVLTLTPSGRHPREAEPPVDWHSAPHHDATSGKQTPASIHVHGAMSCSRQGLILHRRRLVLFDEEAFLLFDHPPRNVSSYLLHLHEGQLASLSIIGRQWRMPENGPQSFCMLQSWDNRDDSLHYIIYALAEDIERFAVNVGV
jgi:hypothetical protein